MAIQLFQTLCILAITVISGAWLRRRARAGITLWLIVTVAVPTWVLLGGQSFLQPLTVTALVLVPAITLSPPRRLRLGDWCMIGFATSATLAFLFFSAPQSAWLAVFTQWIAAYAVGRTLGPLAGRTWVTKAIAIAGLVAAVWSVLEFSLNWHIFEGFAITSDRAGWDLIQTRSGLARSEGAFGHSIALGGFISLSLPFLLASGWPRRVKWAVAGLLLAGVTLTFSRAAIIGFALGAAFWAIRGGELRGRIAKVGLLGLIAVALLPLISTAYNYFSEDFDPSTDYRVRLAESFIRDIRPLGVGNGFTLGPLGYSYGPFSSIDNAYALLTLSLGYIPVVFLLVGLLASASRLTAGRSSPADISILAQAAVLGSVALITQYGYSVFFVAGLAVAFGSDGATGLTAEAPASREAHRTGLHIAHTRFVAAQTPPARRQETASRREHQGPRARSLPSQH